MSGAEAKTLAPGSWVAVTGPGPAGAGVPPTSATSLGATRFTPHGSMYSPSMRSLPTSRNMAPPSFNGWGLSGTPRGDFHEPLHEPPHAVPAMAADTAYVNKEFYGGGYAPSKSVFIEDVGKKVTIVPAGFLKMFPTVFLLFCAVIFVMPIYLILIIGGDINVRKWFPHISFLVMLLPVLYIITFFVHYFSRRPSRILITLSLIGSCVMLLIISDVFLFQAYHKAPMFASSLDCASWGDKREVQDQWKLARSFYASCMATKAKTESVAFAAAVHDYRIQDCPDYAEEMAKHPDWAYLQALEENEQCAGWCNVEEPMWTRSVVQDACSPVVAQILREKVQTSMKQVCLYTIFTLLVLSVVLLGVQPLLEKYGIAW